MNIHFDHFTTKTCYLELLRKQIAKSEINCALSNIFKMLRKIRACGLMNKASETSNPRIAGLSPAMFEIRLLDFQISKINFNVI